MAQGFDEVEQTGLAAAFLRGLDDQAGRGVPGRNGVGGGDPQHDRGRGVVVGQDDVGADRGFDLVQQLGAVDQIHDVVTVCRDAGHGALLPAGVRGSASPRVRPEVMVASASVAVKAPAPTWSVQAERRWSRTVCSSIRPPADELAESDGGGEQGVVPGAGGCDADAGGLTGKRGGRVALP